MPWARLAICKLAVRRDTPVYMNEIWRNNIKTNPFVLMDAVALLTDI
jgi:hypothetical protein